MLFASCCQPVGVPPLWRRRPNNPSGIIGASGCPPQLPTTPGGLHSNGTRGPPLFVVSGTSHNLCSGNAEAFDITLLNPGASSELPLWLFLVAYILLLQTAYPRNSPGPTLLIMASGDRCGKRPHCRSSHRDVSPSSTRQARMDVSPSQASPVFRSVSNPHHCSSGFACFVVMLNPTHCSI
jgi:hypothetical protein